VASRTLNREKIEQDRQEHEKHRQMQSEGQNLQRQQMQDLLHNPQVVEKLTKPDLDNVDDKVIDIAGEHLHSDQVLSMFDRDDLWRKGWGNKIWTGRIMMSYPFPESLSDNARVNEIQRRIHGHDKRPLRADERRELEALMEQKTDREKRGKNGQFVELFLSQVVRSEERSNDSGKRGPLSSLLGGGES